jgi:hypothetical protein
LARAMLEWLRSATMVTTGTILTRAHRMDITGLVGLPGESSSAPARGFTGSAGVAASDAALADAASPDVASMGVASADVASLVVVLRAVVSPVAVRLADSMVARFAAEGASTGAAGSMAEAVDSTGAAVGMAAEADTAKLIS